jgi:predicted HicB family RNase H-like nuclease
MFNIKISKAKGDKHLNTKDYLLKMPIDLHKKLKSTAALKGVSMMEFIINAIEKALKEG